MKLSDVQIKVLQQLSTGDKIHYRSAFGARTFFDSNMKTVSIATFFVLQREKLLICIKKDWATGLYKISNKGKQYIKALQKIQK